MEDVPFDDCSDATLLVAVFEQPVAIAATATPAIIEINFLFMLFSFLRDIPFSEYLLRI